MGERDENIGERNERVWRGRFILPGISFQEFSIIPRITLKFSVEPNIIVAVTGRKRTLV